MLRFEPHTSKPNCYLFICLLLLFQLYDSPFTRLSDRFSAQFKTIFVHQFATGLYTTQKTFATRFNVVSTCFTDNMSSNKSNDGELLANFISPNWSGTSIDCNNNDLGDNLFMNLTKILNYVNITTKITVLMTLIPKMI